MYNLIATKKVGIDMINIKINSKIYDIVNEYPEVLDIMAELGFRDITKPGMLQTAGRVMTIENGAKMKRINMERITAEFAEHGYELVKEDNYE